MTTQKDIGIHCHLVLHPQKAMFVRRFSRVLASTPRQQFVRSYSTHDLDPAEKKDYTGYVDQWKQHFRTVEDNYELERGLNIVFTADWVPSLDVVTEALQATRRLNTFATAVRILEALEDRTESKKQYQQYLDALKPLMNELDVVERKDLGEFHTVRDRARWWY
jgi:cytochrome c oxidase subunit 5a